MAKSTKRPAKITFSESLGNDEYKNHSRFNESVTGVHIHRNDDTAKSFKKKVESVAAKLEDFNIERQDSKYALLVRPSGVSVDDFLEEAPF